LHPNRFNQEDLELAEEALDAGAMLAHLPISQRAVRCSREYDERSLAWLLDQTAARHAMESYARAPCSKAGGGCSDGTCTTCAPEG